MIVFNGFASGIRLRRGQTPNRSRLHSPHLLTITQTGNSSGEDWPDMNLRALRIKPRNRFVLRTDLITKPVQQGVPLPTIAMMYRELLCPIVAWKHGFPVSGCLATSEIFAKAVCRRGPLGDPTGGLSSKPSLVPEAG